MVKRFVFWGMLCHHRGLDTQEFISKLIRFRYIFKVYSDDDTTYVMLGSENQPAIHYAMPLRNMIYDALSLLARMRLKQAGIFRTMIFGMSVNFCQGFPEQTGLIPLSLLSFTMV